MNEVSPLSAYNSRNLLQPFVFMSWIALWIFLSQYPCSLDESGTHYVVDASFGAMLERVETIQGQSPIAYIPYWLSYKINESLFGLRFPSLIFSILSAISVCRVASLLFPGNVPIGAGPLLLFLWEFLPLSLSARPYPVAICFFVWSIFFLIRVIEKPSIFRAIFLGVLVAATIHAHFFFILGGSVYLLYLALQPLSKIKAATLHLNAAVVVTGVSLLSLLPQLQSMWYRRHGLGYMVSPSATDTMAWLVPNDWIIPLLVLLLVMYRHSRRRSVGHSRHRNTFFLVVWYLAPILTIYSLTFLLGLPVRGPKYMSWGLPASAILLALIINATGFRKILTVTVVVISIVRVLMTYQHGYFYQSKINAKLLDYHQKDCVFFSNTGFIEHQQSEFLEDLELNRFLTSALRMIGIEERIEPIPFFFSDPRLKNYRDQRLNPYLAKNECIVVYYPLNFGAIAAPRDLNLMLKESGFMIVEDSDHLDMHISAYIKQD